MRTNTLALPCTTYRVARKKPPAAPALRASLARCAGKSWVQTWLRNVQLLAQPSTVVPDRPLHASVRRLSTAASSIRYSAFSSGSAMPAQHTRAFSVAGPSLWKSPPDSLRDPDLGKDGFRRLLKTHLFTLYRSIYVLEMLQDDTL